VNYLGIDPGFSGALAVIRHDGSIGLSHMPTVVSGKRKEMDETTLLQWIGLEAGGDAVAVIEKAQAMPKQGSVSMFRYGMSYGMCRMVLTALEIPYRLTHPATWKKVMLQDVGVKDKGASILMAKQLFPGVDLVPERARKENHNWAEALLLAAYARTVMAGVVGEG